MGLGKLIDAMHYSGWAFNDTPLPSASDWALTVGFFVLGTLFAVWYLPRHRLK